MFKVLELIYFMMEQYIVLTAANSSFLIQIEMVQSLILMSFSKEFFSTLNLSIFPSRMKERIVLNV